jgi:Ca2+:H+ antiporter
MLSTIRSEAPFLVAAATAAVMYTVGYGWFYELANPLALIALLVWIFVVMLWASFAAVRHADGLAELLGEPYGTLILTIAVISIEVSVVAAIMLNADPDPELARDTMLAVLMIVLNLVVGLSLLVGGLRFGEQAFNLQGAHAFLAVLIPLSVVSLILPRFTVATSDPSLSETQAILFVGVTVALYATFLAIQTSRHRAFFVEPAAAGESLVAVEPDSRKGHGEPRSIGYHGAFLLLTLVPIVLLSKKFAILVDYGTSATGAPPALGGVVVAILVLAPEAFAALEAAYANRLQRSVNICLGSALATIGLTVPAVLLIGVFSGIHVVLGLADAKIVLLALTLFVASLTFGNARTNMLQGMVHLALFAVYLVLIFD